MGETTDDGYSSTDTGLYQRLAYAAAWPAYALAGAEVSAAQYRGTGEFTVLDETATAYELGVFAATVRWFAFSSYALLATGAALITPSPLSESDPAFTLPALALFVALLMLAWLSLDARTTVTKAVDSE